MPFIPHALGGIIFLNNLRTAATILNVKEQNKDIASAILLRSLFLSSDGDCVTCLRKSATLTFLHHALNLTFAGANKTKSNIACLTTLSPPHVNH